MLILRDGKWVNWKNGSGKLTNPGKTFYLKLAAVVLQIVERDLDEDNVSYVRKAIMVSGMALNLIGQLDMRQFFPHLQEIVEKYSKNFAGSPVFDSFK